MANYTDPYQAVLDYVVPKLQYNAYHDKENTLILWLNQNCKKAVGSFGEYIRIPLQYGHTDDSTDIAKNPFATFSTTEVSDQDALKFKVSGFVKPMTVSNWKTEVLVGNDKNRVYDYVLGKTKTMMYSATRILSDRLFGDGGATATDTIGLRYHLDQSDTSYGGLTRSSANTYGLWPNEDTSTTVITWGGLENAYMDSHAATDVIITTKDIYGFIWALRQAQERYNPGSGKAKIFEEVGAPYINFNGIPIVWDERCPANYIFGLSKGNPNKGEQYIYFFVHKTWNLGVEKVVDKTKDQEVTVFRSKWAGQLCFSRCDTQFAFTNIQK